MGRITGVPEDLPDQWLDFGKSGPKVKKKIQPYLPARIYVDEEGSHFTEPGDGRVSAWFIKAPFLICPACGSTYDRRTGEFRKFSALSSEGRSTSTTLLCSSIITRMKDEQELAPEARKILSFTDNRQDASLQSGHFNDFIQIGLIRARDLYGFA